MAKDKKMRRQVVSPLLNQMAGMAAARMFAGPPTEVAHALREIGVGESIAEESAPDDQRHRIEELEVSDMPLEESSRFGGPGIAPGY